MGKSEIQSVDVSFLLHATEDEPRVIETIQSALSISLAPAVEVLEGHFGNRIVHVKFHGTGEEAKRLFRQLSSMLSRQDKGAILEGIDGNLDEHGALYLRFNRQELLSGRLVVSREDPLRVRVKPRAHSMKGDPAEFYKRMMGV